ncbi:PilW family protein [Massilia sp. LjRoot122]|uniref:PilW family protein n=1 Tax=Massilia sp. LjRoot122 TaxID=3342257 RepID=UPI003ECFE6E8
MRHLPSLRRARGFSLAELMIASSIGLLILAALSTMFVKNTRAQQEIEKSHRQVENGRYAIDVLAVDLRNAGYYAEFDPTVLASPAALPALCATNLDGLKAGLVLPVQGLDDGAALPACLSDVRQGTDVLLVRRTATCVAGVGNCAPVASGGPFFQASLCNNATELDSPNVADFYALSLSTVNLNRHQRDCSPVANSGTLAAVRRYHTHVYYIANNNRAGDGIPTLKRLELSSTGEAPTWTSVPLAEGIENLQVEYGLDLAKDGVADRSAADPASADGCTAAACAVSNWRSAVAVRVHVLARNTEATPGYKDTKTYTLGLDADGAAHTIAAPNDGYKRHVFQTQVALPNPAGRRIP